MNESKAGADLLVIDYVKAKGGEKLIATLADSIDEVCLALHMAMNMMHGTILIVPT